MFETLLDMVLGAGLLLMFISYYMGRCKKYAPVEHMKFVDAFSKMLTKVDDVKKRK